MNPSVSIVVPAWNRRKFLPLLLRILNVIGLFTRVDNGNNNQAEILRLQKLAGQYRVDGDPSTNKSAHDELLRKIAIIPSSLALARAANESAWGKSRFAQETNNLFGIWTYDKSKGLKPKNREQGKTHLVRIYDHVSDSVSYYIHTGQSPGLCTAAGERLLVE